MRVSRGEGWVMLSLFTHIPPPCFFSTLNASLVASSPPRQRHGYTQPHHSTPSAFITPSLHAFNSAFLTSSHLCPLPVLSDCLCTPSNFNPKYCFPCFICPRLAFVCLACFRCASQKLIFF